MYRFLLSARWIGGFLLCVLASLICVRLGIWQLDRLHQKRTINASIEAARSAPPRPVADLLSTDRGVPGRQEYSQIRAAGRYDAAGTLLVRNRPLDGEPGFYVLTPFATVDGPTLWVVRGWVPVSGEGVTVAPRVPAAPTGTLTITARARALETGGSSRVTVGGTTQITRITPAALGPTEAYRAYVELASQRPAGPDDGLTALPQPDDLDEGPHLAYAIQWDMFAVGFLVGYVIVARRRAHEPDGSAGPDWPGGSDGPGGPDGPTEVRGPNSPGGLLGGPTATRDPNAPGGLLGGPHRNGPADVSGELAGPRGTEPSTLAP